MIQEAVQAAAACASPAKEIVTEICGTAFGIAILVYVYKLFK